MLTLEKLIESYEIKLTEVLIKLKNCPLNIEREARLETEIKCYRQLLIELNTVVTNG